MRATKVTRANHPKLKKMDYFCEVGGNTVKPVSNTEGENLF